MSSIMTWPSHMCKTWSRGPAKDLQVACCGSALLLRRSEVQHSNCIACAGQQPSRITQQGAWLQSTDLQGIQAAAAPAALTSKAGNDGDENAPEQQLPAIWVTFSAPCPCPTCR